MVKYVIEVMSLLDLHENIHISFCIFFVMDVFICTLILLDA